MKKILLLGIGPSALSALESLAARFEVVGVVRQAEGEDEVLSRAKTLNVRVLSDISVEDVKRTIMEMQPDCVVASSYNRIFPEDVLSRCRFVNVHYAPLPRYRGRTFINWAIVNGETEFALTIHVMSPHLDAGKILCQKTITIGPHDTAWQLLSGLNEIQREVLGDTIMRFLDGHEGVSQDQSGATYACQRVPADGEIDWSMATDRIYALVRALTPPWPGAHTYLDMRRITIVRALPVPAAPRYIGRVPGRVVGRSRANGYVDVLTGDGILRLYEVIVGEGPVVAASTAITSTWQTLGLRTADLLARIAELENRLRIMEGGNDEAR
jgi:methionyl-tRNA formyltransferase